MAKLSLDSAVSQFLKTQGKVEVQLTGKPEWLAVTDYREKDGSTFFRVTGQTWDLRDDEIGAIRVVPKV